jgi:hypothetical protein
MGDTEKASAGTTTGEEFGLIGKYLRWEKPELLGDVSYNISPMASKQALTAFVGRRRRPRADPKSPSNHLRDRTALRPEVLGRFPATGHVRQRCLADAGYGRNGHEG